jgi:hypothetical protein
MEVNVDEKWGVLYVLQIVPNPQAKYFSAKISRRIGIPSIDRRGKDVWDRREKFTQRFVT